MKNFQTILLVLTTLFLLSLPLTSAQADASIGTITSFKGKVVIQSGTDFIPVTQIGQPVKTGDRIQTRDSEVELTFNDGAVLKLRPFSNASVDERDEESGFWVFKSKKPVRRLNVFIGKMRFKSGKSHRENILQTPTSVCALRGSEAEVGYNNIDSMLKMYAGQPFITGKFVRGFFADPGISAAAKSQVYRSLKQAYEVQQKAKTPVEKARARVAALQVQQKAAKELMKNADPKVKQQAKLAAVVARAAIAAQKAKVVLEQLKQGQSSSGQQDDDALKKAEQAVAEAEAAAGKAAEAAEAGDLDAARKAADAAKGAEGVDTTSVETTSTSVVTTTSSSSSSSSSSTTTEDTTTAETTADTTTAETTANTTTTEDTTTAETTANTTTTAETTTNTTTTETTANTTTTEDTTSIVTTSTTTSSSSSSSEETTASCPY